MSIAGNKLNSVSHEELWQRYCGFLDLTVDEFVQIQKDLLMDQIRDVAQSKLGSLILGNPPPGSVEEFRRTVPLTTYQDYEPYLSQKREDVLAEKPLLWCHSAGRSGVFKWFPYTAELVNKGIDRMLSGIFIASAKEKGRTSIGPGFRFLSILPPAPYMSGSVFQYFQKRFPFRPIPPLEASENMEFQERIEKGFQIALKDGVDVIGAIASVLVKMGESMSGESRKTKLSKSMLHPKVMYRLGRAFLRAKMKKRGILPKDIWPTKAIMAGGMDTVIYRKEIARYWGSEPYQFYGFTESYLLAVQSWKSHGLVFFPDIAFLEFIPYDDLLKHKDDKAYRPSTVLMNELEAGKSYELVISNYHRMPLCRYRVRDILKVISLGNKENGVNLPHFEFVRRADDVIPLGGLAWLDEGSIWQAIANTGLKYTDWSACKEYDQSKAYLRLYIELKDTREPAEIERMVDEQLKIVDLDYRDLDFYLKFQPVRVTILTPGTYSRYIDEKRKEGADLAHLKPPHINPPEAAIRHLLELSQVGK